MLKYSERNGIKRGVKCISQGDTTYNQIGAILDTDGITWKEVGTQVSSSASNLGVIGGGANDGNITTGTGKNNLCEIQSIANVPVLNVTPNKHQFRWRLVYVYGAGI